MPFEPLSSDLQRLQPLVFLPDGMYGLSRGGGANVSLVSACGVRHTLRLLASQRVWQEHTARVARTELVSAVVRQIAIGRAESSDLLAYFLTVVAPRFERRDFGGSEIGAMNWTGEPQRQLPAPPDLAAISRHLPVPALPRPGLLVLNRVWRLASSDHPPGVHVCVGHDVLAPTGEFVTLDTVQRNWRVSFDRLAEDAARDCIARSVISNAGEIADAFDEVRRTGAVQRGALVFLNSSPPRIGHIMPRHFNCSLDREVRGDVALTTPFHVPPRSTAIGELQPFARTAQGTWVAVELPRGICIGSGVPGCPPTLHADLAAIAYLRWAATRIAANGRFHEHDGRFEE